MKKIIAFIFAALFAAGVFGATETVDGVTYTYRISNGEATIVNEYSAAISTSTSGDLVIPSKLGGHPVTTIGGWAFCYCRSLTSVTIPEGVTTIGDYALGHCSSLTSVTIPNSVTAIGSSAFDGCSSLTSVTIPDGVMSIDRYAFYDCSSLTSVTIPDSVTSIGSYAFECCSSLESVTIPDSVTTIGNYAFYLCSSLASVTIPEGVTTIGDYALGHCSSLTSVTIPDSVTTIGESAFCYCSSLISVTIPNSVTTIGLDAFYETPFYNAYPNGFVVLGKGVLYKYKGVCPSIVSIPEGVTTIGSRAFEDCSSLASVAIPDSVMTIESDAFLHCGSLTTIRVENGDSDRIKDMLQGKGVDVETLTFENVEIEEENLAIKSIDAAQREGDGIVDIIIKLTGTEENILASKCAFVATNTATHAKISMKSIHQEGDDIFDGATYTRHYVWNVMEDAGNGKIDDVEIYVGLNFGCVQLWEDGPYWSECNIGASSPEDFGYKFWWGDTIGYTPQCGFHVDNQTHNDVLWEASNGVIEKCKSFSELCSTDGALTSQLLSLGYIEKKDGGYSLKTEHDAVMKHVGGSWRMPTASEFSQLLAQCEVTQSERNGVGGYLLTGKGNYSTANIFLPASGIPSSDGAISDIGLTGLYWSSTYYGSNGSDTRAYGLWLRPSSSICTYIPCLIGMAIRPIADNYEDTRRLSTHIQIIGCEEETGVLSENVNGIEWQFTINGDEVTVGAMINGVASIDKTTSGNIIIPKLLNGYPVTSIGRYAFCNCKSLTSIEIPESIKVIDDYAFYGCSSVTSITIPESVKSIGCYAFQGCNALRLIDIPSGVDIIGYSAFRNCASLEKIFLPQKIVMMGMASTFEGCVALKSLELPDGVTSIANNAFRGCKALTKLSLPSSIDSINNQYYIFSGCTSLREICVGNGDIDRIKELMRGKGVDVDKLKFVERGDIPVIAGDDWAEVTGDAENGFVVKPSAETTDVVITIPEGVAADKVTIEVSPSVQSVKANGAAIKVVKGVADITEYLAIPVAVDGVVNLGAAVVKPEIVKEALDPEKGAEIDFGQPGTSAPTITTAPTKIGLTYTLVEGATLESMLDGDSKLGDGSKWTPNITVKGGASGFYTIKVTK